MTDYETRPAPEPVHTPEPQPVVPENPDYEIRSHQPGQTEHMEKGKAMTDPQPRLAMDPASVRARETEKESAPDNS